MCLGKLLWRLGESLVTVLMLRALGVRNLPSLLLFEPLSGILEDLSC